MNGWNGPVRIKKLTENIRLGNNTSAQVRHFSHPTAVELVTSAAEKVSREYGLRPFVSNLNSFYESIDLVEGFGVNPEEAVLAGIPIGELEQIAGELSIHDRRRPTIELRSSRRNSVLNGKNRHQWRRNENSAYRWKLPSGSYSRREANLIRFEISRGLFDHYTNPDFLNGEQINFGNPDYKHRPTLTHKLSDPSKVSMGDYSLKEYLQIHTQLKRVGVNPSKVMNLGTFVLDPEDGRLYFLSNDTVERLSENGIKPKDFRAYEEKGELVYHPSDKGGIALVKIGEDNMSPMNLLSMDPKRLTSGDVFKLHNLVNGGYRDNPYGSSHNREHALTQMDK